MLERFKKYYYDSKSVSTYALLHLGVFLSLHCINLVNI